MLKLLRAVDATLQTQARDRVAIRAASVFANAGADPDAGLPDHKWYRRAGAAPTTIPEVIWSTIGQRAQAMRVQNPLASAYTSLMRLLTRGDYRPVANEDRVQEWLDAFWFGPFNAWDKWLTTYHEEARLVGSIVLPVAVMPDATVRVGYAPASSISEVTSAPFNPRHIVSCRWRPTSTVDMVLPVVRPWIDAVSSKYEGRLVAFDLSNGDAEPRTKYDAGHKGALLWRVNGLVSDLRGVSDLSAAVDFLVAHEDYQAAQAELAQTLGRIAADVSLEGQPDSNAVQEVRERLEKLAGFASVDVHGENETHNYEARNTLGADAAERDRMHGNYAIAPTLIPPHILRGDSGEGNRAVAKEQGTPAFLKVQATIDDIADFGHHACQFALDTAVIQGKFRPTLDLEFRMERPNILRRDMPAAATMLAKLGDALVVAEDREWVSRDLAQRTFVRALEEVGVDDVDIEAMREQIATEEQEFVNRGLLPEG